MTGSEPDLNKEENRLNQYGLKHQIETERKLFNNHFGFQGGVLKYHQWITLFTGLFLINLAYAYDQGAFIYFYLLGMLKISKDTLKTMTEVSTRELYELDMRPITYFLLGGGLGLLVWSSIGASFPDMAFGLVENTVEVLP